MASHGFGLRLAAVLLVLLVLGNECASAKRQIRKSKNQADDPTEGSLKPWIPPPTELKVEVYCDNMINATWEYSTLLEIRGFNATLCNVNQSECVTTHVDYKDRQSTNQLKAHDTRFNFSLYAYIDDERGVPASESFTSFPKIPNVEVLTVKATSPTELKVEWRNKWKHEINLSACSKTVPCVNTTAPAESMAHTFHDLEPGTTYEVTARMTITMNDRTCTGEAAKKSGATLQLAPPTNLSVDVSCSNDAHVKWAYDDPAQITGFFVMLCRQSEPRCENKTLLKTQMEYSFSPLKYNSSYNISVQSFYESTPSKNKTYSKKVTESISSFPKLPELGDISVSGVSETAVNVTWNTKWDGQIAFNICPSPEIPKDCRNYTVYGEAGEHTFEGLASNTTYRIRAQSQVTVQNRTCQGHLHQFLASTTPKRPEKVQNVHYNVENGTILQISWELPEGSEASGFTIKCQDPKTKYTQSQDVSGEKRPYHAAVVLQELVASFSCSLFAFNLDTSGGHFGGPAYGFIVSTNGIAPPANLTLVARNSTSLTFSWSVDPNATKCEITLTPEGGFGEEYEGFCEHDKRYNGTVIHTVTGLHPWTRYNVSVKNCREFCGQPEFLVNITDVAAPSEVLNFSYTIQKEVNVLLIWKKPDYPNGPLDGYLLKVRNDDQNETKTYDVPGDHTEKEMNLKDQFNLFNVSISAYNKAETSNETFYGPESERQLETLGKGPLPPRPKAEEVKEDSAHLAWEEPHDPRYNITGFRVKVNAQPPKEINESSYTMEHLQPWTEYNVSVASCTNKTSCGQWRHLGFKTDFGAPSTPLDLKAPEAGTHWMFVQWEKPKTLNGPLSGYNVSFIHGSSLLNAVTKDLSYNCTELVPGTMYDVSVFAFNEIDSVTKRGPPTTLQATTQADTPSGNGASTTVIALAVVIPLILIILVASYFVYKKYFQTRTGERTPLRTAEGM